MRASDVHFVSSETTSEIARDAVIVPVKPTDILANPRRTTWREMHNEDRNTAA